jgi:nitroreductase
MDVIQAILERYSARDFKPEAVPRETLNKILEAALHSPSSGIVSLADFVAGGAVTSGSPGFPGPVC